MTLAEVLNELIDHSTMSPSRKAELCAHLPFLRHVPHPLMQKRPLWGPDGNVASVPDASAYFSDGTPVPEHVPPQVD